MMVAGRHSNDCDCKDSRRFQTGDRSTHATRFRKSLRTQGFTFLFACCESRDGCVNSHDSPLLGTCRNLNCGEVNRIPKSARETE